MGQPEPPLTEPDGTGAGARRYGRVPASVGDEISTPEAGPVVGGPLLLAAAALAFNAADRRIPFGVWTTGPVDEIAHLSTAAAL